MSERTIQRAERGDTPSLETLRALAASFELSHDQLREHIETQEEMPDMPANDTTATSAQPTREPAKPVLNAVAKRLLIGGGVYLAVMTWLTLMTQFAGWDPELLGFIGILGAGGLATVAFASLGGDAEASDKGDTETRG